MSAVIAVAVTGMTYLCWRSWHDHEQWKRQCERQDLVREISVN
jgi:hypothetical protein